MTQEAQTRERNGNDNEPRLCRSAKLHQSTPLKASAVRINIARKLHPKKRSMTKLDGLYEVLAPGFLAQKTDNFTSINREPGNLDVTVRISNIAKFGTRNERKTKLHKYINRRGPRNLEKSTEAKIQSQKKEPTQIQKSDRKMKHRKRDNASGVLSTGSNIDRAMRVRMPKVRANLAPPETNTENVTNVSPQVASSNTFTDLVPQNTDYQSLIAAPPTSTTSELQLPSTSAPLEPF